MSPAASTPVVEVKDLNISFKTAAGVIKVVETDTIPKIGEARLFFTKRPSGGTEPLGRRIVEFPDNEEQFELRDTHSTFTAYVPVGSVAKGETLAKTGGSGTTLGACPSSRLLE